MDALERTFTITRIRDGAGTGDHAIKPDWGNAFIREQVNICCKGPHGTASKTDGVKVGDADEADDLIEEVCKLSRITKIPNPDANSR